MSFKVVATNLALALGSCVLTVGAVEVALRLLGRPVWDRKEIRAGWKYHGPDPHVNELGYRGQAIRYSSDDIIVVLLGDSQVESVACESEMMPERFLEQYLKRHDPRFKVFTIGAQGYGNDQEYLALRQFFGKYRADLVALWQTIENDVWNNVFPTHWPEDGTIKPTYWLEKGILKGPDYQLEEVVMRPARTKIGVLLNRWLHPQKGRDRYWEERYLPKPYQPLERYEGEYRSDWDSSDPNNRKHILPEENLKNEKSHFTLYLYPRSERTQYGLDLTRKLLAKISDIATEHRSRFVMFHTVSPDQQQRLKNSSVNDTVVHKRDGLFYRTSFKQAMTNMANINEGFPVFRIPITIQSWRASEVDWHLSCRANDQVMRDLATRIIQNMPVRNSGYQSRTS